MEWDKESVSKVAYNMINDFYWWYVVGYCTVAPVSSLYTSASYLRPKDILQEIIAHLEKYRLEFFELHLGEITYRNMLLNLYRAKESIPNRKQVHMHLLNALSDLTGLPYIEEEKNAN